MVIEGWLIVSLPHVPVTLRVYATPGVTAQDSFRDTVCTAVPVHEPTRVDPLLNSILMLMVFPGEYNLYVQIAVDPLKDNVA